MRPSRHHNTLNNENTEKIMMMEKNEFRLFCSFWNGAAAAAIIIIIVWGVCVSHSIRILSVLMWVCVCLCKRVLSIQKWAHFETALNERWASNEYHSRQIYFNFHSHKRARERKRERVLAYVYPSNAAQTRCALLSLISLTDQMRPFINRSN